MELEQLPSRDPTFVLYLLHIFATEPSTSSIKQVAGTQFKNIASRCIPRLSQKQQEKILEIVGQIFQTEDPHVRRVSYLAIITLLRIHGVWPELAATLVGQTTPQAPSIAALELLCLITEDMPGVLERSSQSELRQIVPNLLGVAQAGAPRSRECAIKTLGFLQTTSSPFLAPYQGDFCRLVFDIAKDVSAQAVEFEDLFSAAVQALISAVMVAPKALVPFFEELTDFFLTASRAAFADPPGITVRQAMEVFEYWNSLVDDLPPEDKLAEKLLAPRLEGVVEILLRGITFTGPDREEILAFFEFEDPTHVPDQGAVRGGNEQILDRWNLRKISTLSLENILLDFPAAVDLVLERVQNVQEDPFDIDSGLYALAPVVAAAPEKTANFHEYILHGLRIANPLVQGTAAWLAAELARQGCWKTEEDAAKAYAVAEKLFPALFASNSKFVQSRVALALTILIEKFPLDEFWAAFDKQFDAVAGGVAGLQLRPLAKVLDLLIEYCQRLPERAARTSFVTAATASLLKCFEGLDPQESNFLFFIEMFEQLVRVADGAALEEIVKRVYPTAFGTASAVVEEIRALGVNNADRWPDAGLFYATVNFVTAVFAKLQRSAEFLLDSHEFPLLALLDHANAITRVEINQAVFLLLGEVVPLFPARFAPVVASSLGAIKGALNRPQNVNSFNNALWAFGILVTHLYAQVRAAPDFETIVAKVDLYLSHGGFREPIPSNLAVVVCRLGGVDAENAAGLFEKHAELIIREVGALQDEDEERVASCRGLVQLLRLVPEPVFRFPRAFVPVVAYWSDRVPPDLRASFAEILGALAKRCEGDFNAFLASFGANVAAHVTRLYSARD
eukprot:gnl/Chilomastix_cuspidata/1510.p1 GENE.gnl/Chilomastix_cuspidata/1510~~gnl/Chilomastix_cuspidata/1510.p1  ORF type:complete len:892 (+),score=424.79 gnl/Chilomastix_cuspidata/1510:130-2676(+)